MNALVSTYALGWFGLVASYVVLAALLLSINLWARVRWWIKASVTVVVTVFFFVSFVSVEALLGWPTDQKLPDRFELVYAKIVEPNPESQNPGAIYVWAMALPGSGPVDEDDIYTPGVIDTRSVPGRMPRAYRLPYSRGLHKKVFDARMKVIEGVAQIGLTARTKRKSGETAQQSEFRFYARPDPILPPKDPRAE